MNKPLIPEDPTMTDFRVRAAAPVLAAALLMAGAGSAFADVHYYDGEQARRVTVQPDLRAEFSPGSQRRAALSATGAVPLQGIGDSLVRIYQVPATAQRTAAPGAGSAVYREGDSPAGRLMALPGGVMVKFKPEWTRAQIDAWVSGRGLALERKLAMSGNWFLLSTPAGEASLNTANAIFESGEVLAASPNWWKQTVVR